VTALLPRFRRLARDVQRDLWPSPEHAVLQELERRAKREPRRTRGLISIAPYRLEYSDAMSAWPQWDDIFIHDALAFDPATLEPRILDCGANVGVASMYFKWRYPRAAITAFEADPALAAICRRNLTANAADVDVQAAAVWIAGGEIEFICEGADSGAIAALDPAVSGDKRVVAAVRLRDWLNEPIDLLKIDIEGAEVPVLEDCRDALRNVRCMVIDLHEFDPGHRQTGRLFDLLAGAGFAFDMRSLSPLPWRAPQVTSPFPDPAPVWAVTVRAWRH
jgi:FkbM family methyltransferase